MPREHGRNAAGGNCNDERRAIDDRGNDEARQLRIVDHVHEHVALASGRGDACIHGAIVGGGDREQGAVKVGGLETRATCTSETVPATAPRSNPAWLQDRVTRRRRRWVVNQSVSSGATTVTLRTRHRAAAGSCAPRPHRRRRRARDGRCRSANSGKYRMRPPQPSRPWMPHSRFRPKNRVASASPASASVRVVCQSPIET